MLFPKNLVQIAENFIANPPASGVELNELMKLHLRLSMALRLHAVLNDIPREEIEGEIELCEGLWRTIEICLGKELDEDDDDDFGARFTEDPPPPPTKAFFVNGNATLH